MTVVERWPRRLRKRDAFGQSDELVAKGTLDRITLAALLRPQVDALLRVPDPVTKATIQERPW